MKKRLIYSFASVLVAVFLIVSMINPVRCIAASDTPVKIGALVAFTGFNAMHKVGLTASIELKLDEVGWEVAGRKIELLLEDNASNPNTAADKARKLVEHDNVDVVLGPLLSMFTVANYLTKSKTPNICFMHNGKGILELGGRNIFLHFGTLEGLGYPLGQYIYDTLGYRTAVLVNDDFVAGEDFVGGTAKGFKSRGGQVLQQIRTPPGNMDYSANIATLKEADCVIYWFTPMSTQRFITQYFESGKKMPLVLPCSNVAGEQELAEVGDAALGMIGTSMYTCLFDNELNNKYVEAFRKKVGRYPRTEDASAYIATNIFLEAVKATNGDTSHEAINAALRKLKVKTIAGEFSYTDEGLGIGDLYLQKVVKLGDRYVWEPIFKYEQIVLDVPKE